jgi:hypothetical protein
MDVQLADYLFNDVSKITTSFVSTMISNGIKKNEIMTFVIHFFSRHLLTNNIWLLNTLINYINEINECKVSNTHRLTMLFYDIFVLMGYCEKKHYKFVSENDSIDMFYHEIHDILIHTIEKENTNINILKDILFNY